MAFLKNPKAFVGGVINMNFRGIESWQVRLLHKSSQQPSKTHYVLNIVLVMIFDHDCILRWNPITVCKTPRSSTCYMVN
jgi:hypothetical protein